MAQSARFCFDTPNVVLIGLPNLAALKRAWAKIKAAGIPHCAWDDPDFDFGMTSIATVPLIGDERKVLANYRVYNNTSVALRSAAPSKGDGEGSIPSGRANGDGASASLARP